MRAKSSCGGSSSQTSRSVTFTSRRSLSSGFKRASLRKPCSWTLRLTPKVVSMRPMWKLRSEKLGFPRPLAVGIVNVTDDSFYPGARSVTADQAVLDGVRLAREGFDLIDVGAVAAQSGPPVPSGREAARL